MAEPQIGFRARDKKQKRDFDDALDKQTHVANATKFFESVVDALIATSKKGDLVEWPIKFVTKPKD